MGDLQFESTYVANKNKKAKIIAFQQKTKGTLMLGN